MRKDWCTYCFDDMAIEIKDRVEIPKESGFDRYVGLKHLDSGSLKIWRWGSTEEVEKQKMLFKTGDIIFGRRNAYLRRVAIADFDGVCSAHAMVLRAKPEVVLPDFLPFFMQTEIFWQAALRNSAGSLSPTINWSNIKKEEFTLPSISEQRKIIEVLACANRSSNLMTDLSQHAFNLEAAYLRSLIPPVSRDDGGAHLPNEFLSNGWTLQSVGKIGRVIRGSSPRPKSDPRYYGGSVPRLTVEDINRDGMYVTAKVDSLTEEGAKLSRPVSKGTLVLVCSGNIGEPSILAEDACIHDGILAVTDLNSQLSSEYLYYAFKTLKYDFLRMTTNGGIWSNLTTDVLKSIEVPVPPKGSLKEIVDRIMKFTSAIKVVKHREVRQKKFIQNLQNFLLGNGDQI